MQTQSIIKCPKCGNSIELTDALRDQLRQEMQSEFNKQLEEKEKALKEQSQKDIQKVESDALAKATLLVKDKLDKLEENEDYLKKSLKESKEREKALLTKEQSLQEKIDDFELIVSRTVNEKTTEIRNALQEKANLEKKESQLRVEQLTKQIAELQKRAEQGSQQMQGEVLEEELADILKAKFPYDVIEPIGKGVKGGDVIHRVKNSLGEEVGVIMYESKNTKSFNGQWIAKLKSDMLMYKVDLGVILSTVLPEEINHIGEMSGVWVSDYSSIIGLVTALRSQLLLVASVKRSEKGKGDKALILYEYLVSNEFKQRIEAIAAPFVEMQKSLAQEKRAMSKIWNTREKQIESVLDNMAGFTGDIIGITGKQLIMPVFELVEGKEERNEV